MANIKSCLELARRGHREGALNCFLALGAAAVPRLEETYRAEPDPALRSVLVEAGWRLRSPAVFDFLAEALQDPHPDVWRQALDGLVALASPEAVRVLEATLDWLEGTGADDASERREWIEGAIEDASGRVNE